MTDGHDGPRRPGADDEDIIRALRREHAAIDGELLAPETARAMVARTDLEALLSRIARDRSIAAADATQVRELHDALERAWLAWNPTSS